MKRMPMPIYREPPALALALGCGLVAATAFFFTDGKGDTLVDSVLGLRQENPLLRGICVGLTVLVLIRSKILSFKGAEIGGEIAYNSGRVWVMQSLNRKWVKSKNKFVTRNLTLALGISYFENKLLEGVRANIQLHPEEYRRFVENQIANVVHSRPSGKVDSESFEWQVYYSALIKLALDYAGSDAFDGFTQFR